MNRRNVFKTLLFGLAFPFAKKADAYTLTIPIYADTTKFKAQVRQAIEDLAGIPPEPSGVLGVTYFKVGSRAGELPKGTHLFLDGVDVTTRACEADLVAGWVVLYDVDANGRRVVPVRKRVYRPQHEILLRWGPIREGRVKTNA